MAYFKRQHMTKWMSQSKREFMMSVFDEQSLIEEEVAIILGIYCAILAERGESKTKKIYEIFGIII